MEKVIMYKPESETMPRDKLLEHQLKLFRKQMAYVYERAPFYRKKFDDAGVIASLQRRECGSSKPLEPQESLCDPY
jgi:phenylacetate-coenzyme A ligase PaaK-like adenylate-forming protein